MFGNKVQCRFLEIPMSYWKTCALMPESDHGAKSRSQITNRSWPTPCSTQGIRATKKTTIARYVPTNAERRENEAGDTNTEVKSL
jgi:hypothetical protein